MAQTGRVTRLAVAALVLSLLTPAGAAAEERPMVRRGPFLRAPTYDAWLEGLRTFTDSSYDPSNELVRALGTLGDEDLARLPPVVAKLLPDAKGKLQDLLVLLVRIAAPRGVGSWADVVPGLVRLAPPDGLRALRAVATSGTDGAGPAREALRAALERDPKAVAVRAWAEGEAALLRGP